MAELSQTAEVYVPRSMQLWRGLMNWLAFFFRLLLQIVSNTPFVAQILSYTGLLPQSHGPFLYPSSSHSFMPLPAVEVELPLRNSPSSTAVDGLADNVGGGEHCTEKLTCLQDMLHASLRLKRVSVVVLDLDETLVCAYETSSLPAIIRAQATEAGLKWFELEFLSSDKECEGEPKINKITVFERPGLREFLKQIGGFADLVLFTAGLEGYARPIVDKIDVENQFSLRLYRPSTVSTNYREHVKDLSCLSKDLCRVVIVDNNPFCFSLQPLNGIPCISFSAGQPHDEQLLEVVLPLLKHLSLQNDVRPVLYKKFHMPKWFQIHGIPASGLTV